MTTRTIRTPRGTFEAVTFPSEEAARSAGFSLYFTNDNGTDIFTKSDAETHHTEFAIIKAMKRKFDFGCIDYEGRGKALNRVTVEMEYKQNGDKKRFSVSALVWNARHSDVVAGGQCLDSIAPYIQNPVFSEIFRLWKAYHLNDMHPECEHQHAAGWHKLAGKKVTLYHWRMTQEAMKEQRDAEKAALVALKLGETFNPTIDQKFFANLEYSLTTWTEMLPAELAKYYEPKKPLYAGDKGHTETKSLGWLHESEHPDGILAKACPVCGYTYGSEWKYFPIPEEDEKIIYKLIEEGSL
ncbi:hypothetical protein [Holdemania sp. 1001302B_160321_E10]|uniref:hypothetical protein n=1 Tax=Holdemania sp. 1001302B_160321_E10 TaxID=2787120 RepID=UPI001898BED7|nr:hypothetical protein [Holdemania sp. 1001302B_160321_E10]